MRSNPSLPLLSSSLWLRVVVSVRVPFMGQIELFSLYLGLLLILNGIISVKYQFLKPFNCVQTINSKTWKHITVCKQMSSSLFKNVTNNLFTYKSYIYIPTILHKWDVTQGQFLSKVQQVWIQSFPSFILVAIPRLKSSLSYYLLIAGGRVVGLISFPMVLVLWEMQSASSKI